MKGEDRWIKPESVVVLLSFSSKKEAKYCTRHTVCCNCSEETQSAFWTLKAASCYPPYPAHMWSVWWMWTGMGTVSISQFTEKIFTPMMHSLILGFRNVIDFLHSTNSNFTSHPFPGPDQVGKGGCRSWSGTERMSQEQRGNKTQQPSLHWDTLFLEVS